MSAKPEIVVESKLSVEFDLPGVRWKWSLSGERSEQLVGDQLRLEFMAENALPTAKQLRAVADEIERVYNVTRRPNSR